MGFERGESGTVGIEGGDGAIVVEEVEMVIGIGFEVEGFAFDCIGAEGFIDFIRDGIGGEGEGRAEEGKKGEIKR